MSDKINDLAERRERERERERLMRYEAIRAEEARVRAELGWDPDE